MSWHSFELDAGAPRTYEGQGTYGERLASKYGFSVARAEAMIEQMTLTAAWDGLHFDFAKARPGNTFDAHRLLHFAREADLQGALKERLLSATFTQGEAIGDRETLVRLAAEVGLDPEQVRAVAYGDAYGEAVRADEAQARALGISGVPFFVLGARLGVSGAQSADVLLQALQQAWTAHAPLTVVAGSAPTCNDHGCT